MADVARGKVVFEEPQREAQQGESAQARAPVEVEEGQDGPGEKRRSDHAEEAQLPGCGTQDAAEFEPFASDRQHQEGHPQIHDSKDGESEHPQKISHDPGQHARKHGDRMRVWFAAHHHAQDHERAKAGERQQNAADERYEEQRNPAETCNDRHCKHPFLADGDRAFERDEHTEKAGDHQGSVRNGKIGKGGKRPANAYQPGPQCKEQSEDSEGKEGNKACLNFHTLDYKRQIKALLKT